MKTVALIPARSGSKRLPNKNIKLLNGKPLIYFSIDAGLRAQEVDRVIVSTDSEKIAAIAKKYKAEVPFLRPIELAKDDTPDISVLEHLTEYLTKKEKYNFDKIVILRPTTPFKTATLIDSAVRKLFKDKSLSSVRSVTRTKGVFHPYWMFKAKGGLLEPFVKNVSIKKYYQSQFLPDCFRLNGVVDVVRAENVHSGNDMYGKKIGFVEINESLAVDIDDQFDFDLCQYLMEKKRFM